MYEKFLTWWRHQMKHFSRYWPFLRGIRRWPVNSPDKDQWHGALVLSLICTWINGWIKNREAGDLGGHRAHYYVIVMEILDSSTHAKVPTHDQIERESCMRCRGWGVYLLKRKSNGMDLDTLFALLAPLWGEATDCLFLSAQDVYQHLTHLP